MVAALGEHPYFPMVQVVAGEEGKPYQTEWAALEVGEELEGSELALS